MIWRWWDPGPKRAYFIKKITEEAPHYVHLHKVKPGITSWGQVKYGYAENVEEMIKSLRYDILYIENMSLFVDMKILFYTAITIVKGKGSLDLNPRPLSSGSMVGSFPRKFTYISISSTEPPFSRMFSLKESAVAWSNRLVSRKALKASLSRTSAQM